MGQAIVRAMEIGDRIRAKRREVGWTQERLAKAIGVNKSAVAQWETDTSENRRGITTSNIVKVARVLGIRVSDLIDEPGASAGLEISSPDEIALIELYRRMSPRQRDVHLQLFYTSVDLGDSSQRKRDQSQSHRVAPHGFIKDTA